MEVHVRFLDILPGPWVYQIAAREPPVCIMRLATTFVNYIYTEHITRYFRRVRILLIIFPHLGFCLKKVGRQWSRRISLNGCLLFRLSFVRDIPPHYGLTGSWHFEILYWSFLQGWLNPNFPRNTLEYKHTFWGAEIKWNFLKYSIPHFWKTELNYWQYALIKPAPRFEALVAV